MLSKFMAIPHHTYLFMKMPVPNEILSVLVDIMVSYNSESVTVELSKDLAIKATRNGHGRPGSQDRPNNSAGTKAEAHNHNFGPEPNCRQGLPRPARRM
jgi:hypothetical protein